MAKALRQTQNKQLDKDLREQMQVKRPATAVMEFSVIGTSWLVHNNWSLTAAKEWMIDMETEKTQAEAKPGKTPRDYNREFEESLHHSTEGWIGIPASGLRKALCSVVTLAGKKAGIGKRTVFVLMDGVDRAWGTPLVRITGTPAESFFIPTRIGGMNKTPNISVRGRHAAGWRARVRIRYDTSVWSPEQIAELLLRAGEQCGVGAGRYGSDTSTGMGWGCFEVEREAVGNAK